MSCQRAAAWEEHCWPLCFAKNASNSEKSSCNCDFADFIKYLAEPKRCEGMISEAKREPRNGVGLNRSGSNWRMDGHLNAYKMFHQKCTILHLYHECSNAANFAVLGNQNQTARQNLPRALKPNLRDQITKL